MEPALVARPTLEITRILPATPTTVFAVLARCHAGDCWRLPPGMAVQHCTMNMQPYGLYEIRYLGGNGAPAIIRGQFTLVESPRRIVFSWQREDHAGDIWCDTMVAITLHEHRDGTQLQLEQTAFGADEHCEEHRRGWAGFLDRLAAHLQQNRMDTTNP